MRKEEVCIVFRLSTPRCSCGFCAGAVYPFEQENQGIDGLYRFEQCFVQGVELLDLKSIEAELMQEERKYRRIRLGQAPACRRHEAGQSSRDVQ